MNEKEQMKQLAQMKEQISREFLMITPEALDALRDMITDPNINPIARVQAIGLILERGLGKPETNIRIRNAEESAEAAQDRLDAIFAQLAERADEEKN